MKLKHKLGKTLKSSSRHYKVIGYEYVESRGMRYILATFDVYDVKWIYLFDFEIEMLLKE